MLLHITEKCSMGCPHCMSDAKSDGNHMSIDTLKDVLKFIFENRWFSPLLITGGEPTEHPDFVNFMKEICDFMIKNSDTFLFPSVTITTNGFWILDHIDEFNYINSFICDKLDLKWQVSVDNRYYPKKLDTTKAILRNPNIVLCKDCVEHMYPQGRALNHNYRYDTRAPKCYNIRSMSKMGVYNTAAIIYMLTGYGKFCTPSFQIDGSISLGESSICPVVGSIYDSDKDLLEKIRSFSCGDCKIAIDKLSSECKERINIK